MLKKTAILFFFMVSVILFYSFTAKKPGQQVLKTIIIDAGHGLRPGGGHDGARGAYSYEDEICYDVSKKLVALVDKHFPGVKVIETRPTKYITSLHERADIANRNRGDLFISIHVNAMPDIRKTEFLGYDQEVYYVKKGKKKIKKTRSVPKYRHYTVPNTYTKGTETSYGVLIRQKIKNWQYGKTHQCLLKKTTNKNMVTLIPTHPSLLHFR
jgi:N-acetylmuramoyl-L-alanine amidase